MTEADNQSNPDRLAELLEVSPDARYLGAQLATIAEALATLTDALRPGYFADQPAEDE